MKKILVPVDFSSAMNAVIAEAREQAQAFAAELHLLHVREASAVPVFPAATMGYPGMGMPEMAMGGGIPLSSRGSANLEPDKAPNEQRTLRLETLREELSRLGLRVFVSELDGTVIEEILQAAEELPADLIVLGTHGHGAVYNLLVGSVTEGVLKARPCPILVVPAPAATS